MAVGDGSGSTSLFHRRSALRILIALIAASVIFGQSGAAHAAEIARYQPMAPPPISADAVFVTDIQPGPSFSRRTPTNRFLRQV